jgi:hypothetical protein
LLLVAAAATGVFAAAVPPGRVFMSPLPEYLRIIRENEWRWRASAWGFAVSTVLMAAGLAIGTSVGSYRFAIAAFAVFAISAPCWLATLALRLDLTVAAARGTVDQSWYDAIGKWSGSLFGFFMVGGHAAVALFGASLIGDARVPSWTAWVVMVVGAAQALSYVIAWPRIYGMRGLELPVIVPLLPLFIAIPLVLA